MTTLEALYQGEIRPTEFEPDEAYKSAFEELQKLEESLRITLPDGNDELFQDYIDAFGMFNAICESRTFANGFKLAVQLLFECFRGE